MSLELVNTLATLGTFVVIAATAIAAIVQLRHMRGSNQIAALNELRASFSTEEFSTAQQFVNTELPGALKNSTFRYQIARPSERTAESHSAIKKVFTVGNFYESIGILVNTRLIDRDLVLDFWSGNVSEDWKRIKPVAAILRRKAGPAVYENFEYLAVLAEDWHTAHPGGMYPAGVRRAEVEDDWLEADQQYAASLAPA